MAPAKKQSMQVSTGNTGRTVDTASEDIVFACAHCATSFVVDAAAAGLELPCQSCGKLTTVPKLSVHAAAEHALQISELQHQLKENDSQRTEITGYVNQLGIQLHRWQLRLQTLSERKSKLQGELAALCANKTVG